MFSHYIVCTCVCVFPTNAVHMHAGSLGRRLCTLCVCWERVATDAMQVFLWVGGRRRQEGCGRGQREGDTWGRGERWGTSGFLFQTSMMLIDGTDGWNWKQSRQETEKAVFILKKTLNYYFIIKKTNDKNNFISLCLALILFTCWVSQLFSHIFRYIYVM